MKFKIGAVYYCHLDDDILLIEDITFENDVIVLQMNSGELYTSYTTFDHLVNNLELCNTYIGNLED